MRVLQRLLLALPLLLLAFGMAAGCHSTVPSLLLHIDDPTGLAPTQLRVKVSVEDLETHNVTRPEVPNGTLASPQTLRLFMPDEAVGRRVDLTVEALRGEVVVGDAVTVTVLKAVEDTRIELALVPTGALEVCDATTCPFGCCDGNVCIEGDLGACGVGGGACTACDASSTDKCVEGECRCGADVPCPAGYQCQDGACAPDGEGQSCTVDEQCNRAPGQCSEQQGTCGEDGKCAYAFKAENAPCDDGDSCTEGDHCDGKGLCVVTPIVCDGPTGQCLVAGSGECFNGTCRYESKSNTTECNDNNDCTRNDFCDDGSCKGDAFTCNNPPNDCWKTAGTCENDDCTYEPKQAGATCGTNDACTQSTCDGAGQCVSSPKKTCINNDNTCRVREGECNGATGACTFAPKNNTTQCGTNNACESNMCNGSGQCVKTTLVVCNNPGQCEKPNGTCNTTTGACTYAVDEGAGCTDTDQCTSNTTCQSDRTCGGGTQKTCTTPANPCKELIGCNPDTGVCDTKNKKDGTVCGDVDTCSHDVCESGVCKTKPRNVGSSCDDGDACKEGSKCLSNGTCGGGSPKCTSTNVCRPVKSCNPSTGACTYENASYGTSCGSSSDCSRQICNGQGACISEAINQGDYCGIGREGCMTCQSGACVGCPTGTSCCNGVCKSGPMTCDPV